MDYQLLKESFIDAVKFVSCVLGVMAVILLVLYIGHVLLGEIGVLVGLFIVAFCFLWALLYSDRSS